MEKIPEGVVLESVEKTFTPELISTLLKPVKLAYETASDGLVPEWGDNQVVFGIRLYHHIVKRITELSKNQEFGLKCFIDNQTFRLVIGEFVIAIHRVGQTEKEPIHSSFPNNDKGAAEILEPGFIQQLTIPGFEKEFEKLHPRKLVLAHFGNRQDGFCAAYLCAPGRVINGKIVQWGYTHELWSRSDDKISLIVPSGELAKVEVVQEVLPSRKRRDKANDG